MVQSSLANAIHWLRRFVRVSPFGFPLVLLAAALITYGVFITTLGFYWDDWPPLVVSHFTESTSFFKYFSYDRPFQSWTYYLLTPICRDAAYCWQLSAILFRWTSALALYYTFMQVFSRHRSLLQWVALIFVVFPGFSDQYASVSYGSHFIAYTVFGMSLLFMVLAVKIRKRFWFFYPLSLVLTAVHLFTMEYFVGLELLRPVLLFLALSDPMEKKTQTLLKVCKFWVAYIAVLGVYLYWRMVLYPASRENIPSDNFPYLFENLVKSPLSTLEKLFATIFADLRFLFISSWTDRLLPAELSLTSITFWLSLIIGLVTAAVAYGLLFPRHEEVHGVTDKKDGWLFTALGFWIIFIGMTPLWSSLRQITAGKWSNRFAIPVMWGVGLVITAVIFSIIHSPKIRRGIFLILIGLSISHQIRVGNDYRKDFLRQEMFYSQLKWRIPELAPGTALYSPVMPAAKEADYSFSTGINLMYSGEAVGNSTDYWMTGPRYYPVSDLLNNPQIQITGDIRTFQFIGSADKVVSIYMPSSGCMLVVDTYSGLMPISIEDFSSYGELTNQDLISDSGSSKNGLADIFDFNQPDDWCYYFEKGDLAVSKGQYENAISFYDQALARNLSPLEGIEYLPFIRAYVAVGKINEASALTQKVFDKSYTAKPVLCKFWQDTLANNSSINPDRLNSVYNADLCAGSIAKVQP